MHRSSYEVLYQLAAPQAGYLTARQATKAGITYRQLSHYAKTGRLQRVRTGLYRLALFPASPHEDLFIAWLEAGPQSVISHESALSLYELSDVLPAEVHVTIPGTASRRHRGMRLHTNRLPADETTWYAGLRVTTIARTIADVAAAGLADELVVQAMHQALRRGLVTRADLRATAESRGGRMECLLDMASERQPDEVPKRRGLP